jgi:hypothetical protein
MEKEFVPYGLALRMKALDYDESCMAYYNKSKKLHFDKYTTSHWSSTCLAPLYQQCWRWFREKYELHSCIHSDYTWNISGGIWDLNEHEGSRYDWDYSNNYSTYEEAELSCLKKLIEIVELKSE